MTSALIFAGGSGNRMNSRSRPKQFLQLYGKEIIIHTLENFQGHQAIDNMVVVCKKDWIGFLERLLAKYAIDKAKWIVPGGETGQESIFNGLKCLAENNGDEKSIVLVHDGVRPFINAETIDLCIETVREKGSAITVTPAIETICQQDSGTISSITERSKCFLAKAPQCFFLEEIYANHLKAREEGRNDFIDSASLMHCYGTALYTVEGNTDNIKITTPADFYTFRALYDVRENQQIFGI
ncbi:MAG: 2-C-methyl-D-erythritol 4-phosphate cytidylyltransferase [Ruminococcus flavefaciens]|nr:2-C-methyl-D-erythritol 4-phosphate cytidylyltransferase [Ruminococcus flavefaciens]